MKYLVPFGKYKIEKMTNRKRICLSGNSYSWTTFLPWLFRNFYYIIGTD